MRHWEHFCVSGEGDVIFKQHLFDQPSALLGPGFQTGQVQRVPVLPRIKEGSIFRLMKGAVREQEKEDAEECRLEQKLVNVWEKGALLAHLRSLGVEPGFTLPPKCAPKAASYTALRTTVLSVGRPLGFRQWHGRTAHASQASFSM